jgi:hypothetical protein
MAEIELAADDDTLKINPLFAGLPASAEIRIMQTDIARTRGVTVK